MTVCRLTQPDRRTLLKSGAAGILSTALGSRIALGQSAKVLDVLSPPSPTQPQAIKMFQEQTGILVRPAPYVSPTDTLGKLLAGGGRFDAMVTLSDLVRPDFSEAVDRKLLTPFDLSKIPNSKSLAPLFHPDIMTKDGKSYSIPLYWGSNPVLYNRKFIREDEPLVNSYALLLDDKLKGRVAIRDDAHESMHMVALCMGIKEPWNMEPKDIKEVIKLLISKKSNFRTMWSKYAEAVQLMASNEVYAMFGWVLMRNALQSQGLDVVTNHPKEGLLWWVHTGFLPAGSSRVDEAHQWINFLASSEWGRKLSEITGSASTSLAAKDSFSKEQQKSYGYDILDSGGPMVRLGKPKHLPLWLEGWSEFKAA